MPLCSLKLLDKYGIFSVCHECNVRVFTSQELARVTIELQEAAYVTYLCDPSANATGSPTEMAAMRALMAPGGMTA
eukprot:3044791-Rhodomonas_salina.1